MNKKELFIIILLVIILSIIALPIYLKHTIHHHPVRLRSRLKLLSQAIFDFKLDCGRYPTQDEGLNVLLKNPGIKGWDGPYLKMTKKIAPDPWGSEYVYIKTEKGFIVKSPGPDRKADTDDDVIIKEVEDEKP